MNMLLFIVPAVLLIAGVISTLKPAKTINDTIGYRSAKSRSSQENWDKAQKLMAKYMLIIGGIEAVLTVIASLFVKGLTEQQFAIFLVVIMTVQTLGVVLVIPMVESRLK